MDRLTRKTSLLASPVIASAFVPTHFLTPVLRRPSILCNLHFCDIRDSEWREGKDKRLTV